MRWLSALRNGLGLSGDRCMPDTPTECTLVLTIRALLHLENDLATGYSKFPRYHNSDIKSDKVARSVKNMK